MIRNIADLLNDLKKEELNRLEPYSEVKHPGIIGDIYEGLTKAILELSIEKLDLRVVNGKIKNTHGQYSGQIDCMLVIGEGEQIPYTDHYLYPPDRVIAIFESKKTLNAGELKKSYDHFKRMMDIMEERRLESFEKSIYQDAFENITGRHIPNAKKFHELSPIQQQLDLMFANEAMFPLRIVWGYYGYKSEYSFRESFYNYLLENVSSPDNYIGGFSPMHFPSLMISDSYSLVKANGMPYNGPLQDEWWTFYISTNENPVYILLELLWTRLSYRFELKPDIFGEDLEVQPLHPFLKGKYVEQGNIAGWEYNYYDMSHEELKEPMVYQQWEPTFLDKVQYTLFYKLASQREIPLKELYQQTEIDPESGYTLETLISDIIDTRLAYIDEEKIILRLTYPVFGTFQGNYFIAEGKDERLGNWYDKNKSLVLIQKIFNDLP